MSLEDRRGIQRYSTVAKRIEFPCAPHTAIRSARVPCRPPRCFCRPPTTIDLRFDTSRKQTGVLTAASILRVRRRRHDRCMTAQLRTSVSAFFDSNSSNIPSLSPVAGGSHTHTGGVRPLCFQKVEWLDANRPGKSAPRGRRQRCKDSSEKESRRAFSAARGASRRLHTKRRSREIHRIRHRASAPSPNEFHPWAL